MNKLGQNEEKIIKNLQHPVRLQILNILEETGSQNYNKIKEKCHISSSTLYYHLKILRGLIKKNQDGSYSLTSEGVQSLQYYTSVFKPTKEERLTIAEQKNFTDHFGLLSNPTRRNMLQMFQNNDKIRYSEFMKELKLSSGILFYHLKFFQNFTVETSDKSYQLSVEGKKLLKSLNSKLKRNYILNDKPNRESDISIQDLRDLNASGDYKKVIQNISPNIESIEKKYLLIDSLIMSGDLDLAETILDELLKNLEDEENIVLGLYYSSLCLIIRGEFSKAQDYLNNSIEIFKSSNKDEFSVLDDIEHYFELNQIKIYFNTNKLDDSKNLSQDLLKQINKGNRKLHGELLNLQGELLWKLGDLETSKQQLELGLVHFESTKNPELIGRIKLSIAKTHYHIGDTDLAQKIYNDAIKYLKFVNNPLSMGQAYFSIAILYRHITEFLKAVEYFEQSLKIYEQYHNANQIVLSLTYLGSIKQSLSEYSDANEYYKKALSFDEYLEDKDSIAVVYKFLAYLKESEGYLDDSIKYYTKANNIFIETDRVMHQMDCLRLLSGVYYIKGDLEKTKECLEAILDLNREIKAPRFDISALNRYGEIYQDKEDFSLALDYFQKAHDLAENWKDEENLYINKLNMGICEFFKGNVNESKILLESVKENSITVQNEYRLAKSTLNLAKIYNDLKINDWTELDKVIEDLGFESPRIEAFSEIYWGIKLSFREEWSNALVKFNKALTVESLDFFEKTFCYESIALIYFNKWKANTSEDNLSQLSKFLSEWEEYCVLREIDRKSVSIQILKAKILTIQLNFIDAKKILGEILKKSKKMELKKEEVMIKKEIVELNKIITKIKV